MSQCEPKQNAPRDLGELRQTIDDIDTQIHTLLMQRAEAVVEVGRSKENDPDPVFYRPEREAQIHRRLKARHQGALPLDALHRVYREIISGCLNLEKQLTVAYLGPEATFTHQAALKHFGGASIMYPARAIDDVFHEVEVGRSNYGVAPVENSTEGVVRHTLDCFAESSLQIIAEIHLPLAHNLLSRAPKVARVRRVYGHAQAIAQCQNWLGRHLPDARIVETASTAEAARRAGKKRRSAAIAGVFAADEYGLNLIAEHIEDSAGQEDRFLVISQQREAAPSGDDKTSLLFSLRNKVGFLHQALGVFAAKEINLTRIESRPSKRKAWDHNFFIDLDGHQSDPRVAEALNELSNVPGINIKILGSYPRRAL